MSPSTPGDAALSVSVRQSSLEEKPVPVPAHLPEQREDQAHTLAHGHIQEPGLPTNDIARAPDEGLKSPAAGDGPKAGVLSTPTTPVLSIENYLAPDQNDKKARGPVPGTGTSTATVLPKRPNGPSLLTQQLAEARGIVSSASGQSLDAPQFSPRLQHLLCDPSIGSHPNQDPASQGGDTGAQEISDDPDIHDHSDGDLLTPRASPRSIAMATTSAVSTLSLPPRAADNLLSRTFDISEIGDVEPRIKSHRDLLRASGRGTSLERTHGEADFKGVALSIRTYSDTSAPPAGTMNPNRGSSQTNARADLGSVAEPATPVRPHKLDSRVSTGPEKVWSIGSEDLNNAQDGQVEKSIAEVLAGVEPNARSRKASHSLRFFKEGLPEKLQRKEGRPGLKEKPSVTDDMLQNATLRKDDYNRSLQQSPDTSEEVPGRLTRTKTFPFSSTGQHEEDGPPDYFQIRPGHKGHTGPQKPLESGPVGGPTLAQDVEEQDAASGTAVGDTVHEDGEVSGEEKISSAVFVPHKGPHGVSEHSDESESDLDVHSKPHQKSDDGSSWLVKADEPEADEPGTPEVPVEGAAKENVSPRREAEIHAIDTNPSSRAVPPPSTSIQQDMTPQPVSKPSELASPGYEDHVHDHQLSPEQPLDAIELVPYRHQVGGHTTVWRFSKKAVCKQLNNRENEFYEQIERYHRDLLPFLPRYIGVLNVTFSKQPRRRSMIKKEDSAVLERRKSEAKDPALLETNQPSVEVCSTSKDENGTETSSPSRLISQSLQAESQPIPTVTFLDNQHILPRSLLQPATQTHYSERFRSSSVSVPASHYEANGTTAPESHTRPSLEDRHANSWGTTVVNKKLRHEVFNDVFSKSPINVQRHKKAHQRTIPRKTLDRLLRPASSDSSLMRQDGPSKESLSGASHFAPSMVHQKTNSDLGPSHSPIDASDLDSNDVTGTSAPEPDILTASMSPERKKRRHSGSALRRRPRDVSDDSRGNLRYWEEPDEAYKGDNEDLNTRVQDLASLRTLPAQSLNGAAEAKEAEPPTALSSYPSTSPSVATSPTGEFKKIPRPVNPKEAQTQRDSRVSYFLLLEDLTAGMKKPCIMDLKMGTRQYGVEATAKKQKSQQRKCAQTTSRELGVRVCGLQVWDAESQEYVFRDKYYGRSIKAGPEFQEALTRFLYDGADRTSILRHIPTVLQKLSKLEVIVQRLRGYRFYAASLLVTYDGVQSDQNNYDTAIEDSTTDFATDNEDMNYVRKRKNKREIDFKIADFANSVTPQDLAKDKSCPPQHPDEPDRGFLKGLRSLRRYFLKIQQDTRAELGLPSAQRNLIYNPEMDVSEDDESVSE
ncbi:inositol polyphosphate kinase kcs1 [Gnomoniopsis sp. IMI 355080]|nr:inositol polyphosphate kinase kcs1 [Gnomoniopsis sp. IMI 355080]